MFDLKGWTFFNDVEVKRRMDAGTRKALSRSGAYLRGIARRMVKHSKKVKSAPGEPPRDHARVYKASILFGLDRARQSVVIGPAKLLTGRVNRLGMPVPQILEQGGPVASGANVHWPYGRHGQPSGNSESAIADFVQRQGYGPIRWGTSVASLIGKAKRSTGRGSYEQLRRARGGYKTWSRYAPLKGRTVYLQNAKMYSRVQAERAARIILELFGPPHLEKGNVAARPLMGPAAAAGRAEIAAFWRDAAA